MNRFMLALSLFVALSILVPVASRSAEMRGMDGVGNPSARQGTIEFTVIPRRDDYPLQKDFLLLEAGTADGSEHFEVHVIAEDLLVVRDFAHCVRSADRTPHEFKKGVARRLAVTWNQETTKFFFDGKEVEGFNLMVVDKFGRYRPSVRVAAGGDFDIGELSVSERCSIPVNPEDRDYVRLHRCPDMRSLLEATTQEEFRGISLQSFPDQKSRDRIRGYIVLLPRDMAAAIKRVIFVGKSYNPDSSWKGMALQGTGTMLVQEASMGTPRTFFHEAAHLYDHAVSTVRGVPISQAWKERFEPDSARSDAKRTPVQGRGHSVLDQMDGSSAHEELADFVGLVYEIYLRQDPPGRDRFFESLDNSRRLEFVMEQGFIGRDVYTKLKSGGR
jgi:hypothetical protein